MQEVFDEVRTGCSVPRIVFALIARTRRDKLREEIFHMLVR